jgi:hypothetical protein
MGVSRRQNFTRWNCGKSQDRKLTKKEMTEMKTKMIVQVLRTEVRAHEFEVEGETPQECLDRALLKASDFDYKDASLLEPVSYEVENATTVADPQKEDNQCSQSLAERGAPYPRTCQKCGLGPCQRA